jgi:cbb3-type cytochrome c oxidase subunit III
MKPRTIIALAPIILLLSGCGQTEIGVASHQTASQLTNVPSQVINYPDDKPSIPDGKIVWEKMNCAQCHGQTGSGGSASVNLADNHWASSVMLVDLYKTVAFGGAHKHPALINRISNRDLWDVVVYARSLGAPPLPDQEVADITTVFGSNCAVCHGTKGDGEGPLAKNLDPMPANFTKFDRFFNRTDDVLFDHIANGIKWEGMPNFLGKRDARKKVNFDDKYIHKLVSFVRNFQIINTSTVLNTQALSAASQAGKSGKTDDADKDDKSNQ